MRQLNQLLRVGRSVGARKKRSIADYIVDIQRPDRSRIYKIVDLHGSGAMREDARAGTLCDTIHINKEIDFGFRYLSRGFLVSQSSAIDKPVK